MARAAVAAAVFFAAWAWFAGGGRWSAMLHPDEAKVAGWTRQAFENGYVTDRVYPGGWFQLARARTGLARSLGRAADKADAWRSQDGAVVAVIGPSFWPRDRAAGNSGAEFAIQTWRDFDALLAAAAALAVFLCARTLGAGRTAAAFGAAVFAAQPLVVEHAHYCETDMALVAFFAAACWLFSRFLRSPSPSGAAPALAMAGFAVSCKYTLVPLAAWIPAAAWLLAARRKRRAAAFAAFLAAGAAAFAAGFLFGTPALVFDPAWFRESAADISARTYAETVGILGPFAKTWWGGPALRLGSFARSSAALGWGFWLPAAAGAAAWARGAMPRRMALGVPLFAALFLPWTLFGLPWFRAQELPPIVVAASVASALSFDAALSPLRRPAAAPRAAAAAQC